MNHLIIFNWKMNLEFKQMVDLMDYVATLSHESRLIIAPSNLYLSYINHNYDNILCAQNVSSYNYFGAYTGEVSASMLKNAGVDYAIIGHSERRNLMNETNKIIGKKLQNCIDAGVKPILCVGEKMENRKNQNYKDYIEEQLKMIPKSASELIIAYEPVWSIGTGSVPTIAEISEIVDFIKGNKYVSHLEKNIELVYGGSVSGKNIGEILQVNGLDGVLVGSASLKKQEIELILNVKK